MPLVNPAKYRELERAVANGEFPIIVYGPSGVGKTHAIQSVLRRHGMQFLYVDISSVRTRRPLRRNTVILSHLYAVTDLDNLAYRDSVIIESNIHYLNKLDGYKLIKFSRMTERGVQDVRRSTARPHNNFSGNLFSLSWDIRQEDYTLELYRFLGRIFHRKISVDEIGVDTNDLYVDVALSGSPVHATEKQIQTPSYPENAKNRSSEEKGRPSRRSLLVDSSEDSLRAGSAEEIDNILDGLESESQHEPERPAHRVSFSKRKILGYLYENMINFGDLDDLRHFYECISLTDRNDTNILTLIQCILERGKSRGKSTFRSLGTDHYRFIS